MTGLTDLKLTTAGARRIGGALAGVGLVAGVGFVLIGWPLRASIALILPLSIGIGTLSLRQYHRYRSALQGLIDGAQENQREAAVKAEAAQTAAADVKLVAKTLDELKQTITASDKKIEDSLETILARLGMGRPG